MAGIDARHMNGAEQPRQRQTVFGFDTCCPAPLTEGAATHADAQRPHAQGARIVG